VAELAGEPGDGLEYDEDAGDPGSLDCAPLARGAAGADRADRPHADRGVNLRRDATFFFGTSRTKSHELQSYLAPHECDPLAMARSATVSPGIAPSRPAVDARRRGSSYRRVAASVTT
jgi:hypothetical protein